MNQQTALPLKGPSRNQARETLKESVFLSRLEQKCPFAGC